MLLIVYGATAGVSVVQLYAGAFFPGIMLAGLYVVYVIILAKLKPALAPPLSAEEARVPIPAARCAARRSAAANAFSGAARRGGRTQPRRAGEDRVRAARRHAAAAARDRGPDRGLTWHGATKPAEVVDISGLQAAGFAADAAGAAG